MKNLLLFFCVLSYTTLQAQIVNIPDANFKNALVNNLCVDTNGDGIGDIDADTNNDGEIQVSEAETVLGLYVSAQNISSLEGIESFANLEYLGSDGNQLTTLNITQNPNLRGLTCRENQLNGLDVTQNPDLEEMFLAFNQLTSLDVTQNPNLKELFFSNNFLSILDVTQNPNLERLSCSGNQLTQLNVTQNPNLISLQCGFNLLSDLDVTQNPNLEGLFCINNQLSQLDVSQNPNLEWLDCVENQLTSLDISQNPNLFRLFCNDNQLTSLNVQNGNNTNFEFMWSYNNPNLDCITVDDETFANFQTCDQDNWCKDNSSMYSENCNLSIADFNAISVSLYPNPAQHNLRVGSNSKPDKIQLYSLQGELVKQTSDTEIDVSDLSSGVYLAVITIDKQTLTKKFIKS